MWTHATTCSHMCLDVVTFNEYIFICDWAMIQSSDAHELSHFTNVRIIYRTVSIVAHEHKYRSLVNVISDAHNSLNNAVYRQQLMWTREANFEYIIQSKFNKLGLDLCKLLHSAFCKWKRVPVSHALCYWCLCFHATLRPSVCLVATNSLLR